MQAIIEITDEQIKDLKEQGIQIVCTDKDAVIIPPITDTHIRTEMDYIRDYHDSPYSDALGTDQKLRKEFIHEIKKDLHNIIDSGDTPTYEDIQRFIDGEISFNEKSFEKRNDISR